MDKLEWAAIRQGELDVLIEEIKRLRSERDLAVRFIRVYAAGIDGEVRYFRRFQGDTEARRNEGVVITVDDLLKVAKMLEANNE